MLACLLPPAALFLLSLTAVTPLSFQYCTVGSSRTPLACVLRCTRGACMSRRRECAECEECAKREQPEASSCWRPDLAAAALQRLRPSQADQSASGCGRDVNALLAMAHSLTAFPLHAPRQRKDTTTHRRRLPALATQPFKVGSVDPSVAPSVSVPSHPEPPRPPVACLSSVRCLSERSDVAAANIQSGRQDGDAYLVDVDLSAALLDPSKPHRSRLSCLLPADPTGLFGALLVSAAHWSASLLVRLRSARLCCCRLRFDRVRPGPLPPLSFRLRSRR